MHWVTAGQVSQLSLKHATEGRLQMLILRLPHWTIFTSQITIQKAMLFLERGIGARAIIPQWSRVNAQIIASPQFPLFSQSKIDSKSHRWSFCPQKNSLSFCNCTVSFSLVNGHLEKILWSDYSGSDQIPCERGLFKPTRTQATGTKSRSDTQLEPCLKSFAGF